MPTQHFPRPYAQDGIVDIERLYEVNQEDRVIVAAIAAELRFRTTDRANRLAFRITSNQLESTADYGQQQGLFQYRQARDVGQPHLPAEPTVSHATPPGETPAWNPVASTDDPETRMALQSLEATPQVGQASLKDTPNSILSAWISLEVLAPLTYKNPVKLANDDPSCIARIGGDRLPWERGEASRQNFKLFYLVLLGEVNIDTTTADLLRTFGDDEEMPKRQGNRAPIAMAIVDKQGKLVGLETVVVSSFAWGVPVVLREKLGSLARWPDAEGILCKQLHQRLSRFDRDGNSIPLDLTTINDCHVWLQKTLGLRLEHVHPPSFVVRLYHYYRLPGSPDSPLINSFFIGDLVKARAMVDADGAPQALKRYLAMVKSTASGDLLQNKSGIAELVAPSRFPLARWPSPGGHPLVTLQQAAVNTARTEFLNDKEGILAVNGPPGTGKTTLLRDLVAHCVTSRAAKLVVFDDPEKAFLKTGEQIRVGEGAFLHMYGLDPSIKGFELLVASSNNKAVENVSKELPAGKSIEPGPKYFASIAKVVSGDEKKPSVDSVEEPWGLIAAVLGNRKNIGQFQQNFWWHKEYGFPIYLKAARGLDVSRDEPTSEGNPPRRVTPAIVAAERPLNGDAALQQWKKTRKSFNELKHTIETKLSQLEEARSLPPKVAKAQTEVERLCVDQKVNAQALKLAETAYTETVEIAGKAKTDNVNAEREFRAIHSARPWLLARLFRTDAFRRWTYETSIKESALQDTSRLHRDAQEKFAAATERKQICAQTLAAVEDKLGKAERVFGVFNGQLKDALTAIGDRFVDSRFFEQEHAAWNIAAPWLDDQIHKERETLFIRALDVHKAFITVAAQKVQHNLGVLMTAMQAGSLQDQSKRKFLADLWSTLFLVIPVVSTTFASVDRMLGDLAPGSFGWLLVDEAGQATPQAAVGALLRAGRAVVVGDPLQIPPVVTIPEKLIGEISKHYGVNRERWCAPEASVQTLADAASHVKAKFSTASGTREVGLPLLVHRRCQDPMFSVSNAIAYDGKMVFASGADKVGRVGSALGVSAWFDIDGDAISKWSPAEGHAVMHLLRQLARAGIQNPDVYVISPFRVVAHEMRQLLRAEPELFRAFGVEEKKWLDERVGTIHTFQGKEAEAVIAILGAPMSSQIGARHWASSTPNILNVMVSRAKSRLYVVGSHAAWNGIGHFAELACRTAVRSL
jgi:AAA domain